MTRCLPVLVLSLVVGLAAPSVLRAEDGPKVPRVEGVVKAVDAASITLEGRKKEGGQADPDKTLKLAAGAKVTIDGEAKTAADLKPGTRALLVLTADSASVTEVVVRTKRPERKEGGEKEGAPRPQRLMGLLESHESGQLVLVQRGDGGERKTTFTVTQETKVQRESDDNMTVPGEGGKTREVPKIVDAALADLKPGQRVTVMANAEKHALSVLIARAPKREKKEGE